MMVIGAAMGVVLLAAVLGGAALLWLRRERARRAATEAEIESLRDEIWELRAASDARDKAEAASLAKSRFLATVSHEIRTPLNGILGLAQLLAMTRLDAEQASYVEAIGDSSRSLAQLIDDILDFSKIEAGKLAIRRAPFALAPLIEGVVELLAPRAQSKNLELASLIAPEAPREIDADAARLRQILVNLVGNAINFTEQGGVGLCVSRQGDGALLFEIEDTGPGVAREAESAIFEEFEQGDPSATRRKGGTGLGLAISRRLVEQMGGKLTLAKNSPQGATFAFTLPAPARAAEPLPTPLRDRRALVVASSRFEAPFLAATLRAAGAFATIAADAPQAMAQLSGPGTQGFDAVVVDCALGEKSVETLAAAARSAGAHRLYLLFSPLERRAFGEAALRHFDGWLVKPLRARSLIERLSQAALDAPRAATPEPTRSFAGLRVLLAEDNDINALIASRHLMRLGAEVSRAENGARALEMASAALAEGAARFDIVLMDLFMPELDGREATRRIRIAEARHGARRTPIIALTASAFADDRDACLAAGMDGFLVKPLDRERLAEVLASAAHPATLAA